MMDGSLLSRMKPKGLGIVSGTDALASTVGFDRLGEELGRDVESALSTALTGGVVFHSASDPLAVFQASLAASLRDIESHPRGRLFQEFLLKGPYKGEGDIPSELRHQRLSDEETTTAIAFIYSFMVNCFKGALAELLASAPCLSVLQRLQQNGNLPDDARLYVGDVVSANRLRETGLAKGADLHILIENRKPGATPVVTVAGVAEVKSSFQSKQRLEAQLDKHILRAERGLRVCGLDYSATHVSVGCGRSRKVVRLTVLPAKWRLPRTFRFEPTEHGRSLHVDPSLPPQRSDLITRIGDGQWQVTLRWSKEALAAAAYEMTFWYMEKVGEVIYSSGVPKEWSEMTPAEAGRNAVKMMLYYAILRCRTARENQRAIALYNSYSFGYALGMSFKNSNGRREMLWPEDLDEILARGKTKHGCSIVEP